MCAFKCTHIENAHIEKKGEQGLMLPLLVSRLRRSQFKYEAVDLGGWRQLVLGGRESKHS